MASDPGLGMVHVYTGDGKGKTTAALGLGLRAMGHGFRVVMVQFMKGQIDYGELSAVKGLGNFEIFQFGRPEFVDKENPDPVDIALAREGLQFARKVMEGSECDMLILDEINVAVEWGLLAIDDVLELVRSRPEGMELVLTGRYAPEEFIEMADTVTEMREVKHPFQRGVLARKGIEH